MNMRTIAPVAVALLALTVAGTAWARNPHCAGGIQYLTQAMGDKQKNNMDDYHREISKAVQQLEVCSSEDPNDFEAMGYLGWAYAEVDSMAAAGKAFQTAIDGLQTKGDKKKIDQVMVNRESFWAATFNKGIERVTAAQALWDPNKEPANDQDKKSQADANKVYDEALVLLNKALALKPRDTRTLRNIGAVHAFKGDYIGAEEAFRQGLTVAPSESVTVRADLTQALHSARTNRASQLIREKKVDEAITYFQDLLKEDPKDADLWAGLGDAQFTKARDAQGDAKKPAFKSAADSYAKAAALNPGSPELSFNAAICYQNADELPSAETQWRAVLKAKPDDREALTELSNVLADQKKFPEAVAMAQKALALDPKDKNAHKQLGAIYNKSQDNLHSKQALLAYLALDKGHEVAAPTPASGAAGTKLAATAGKPDLIIDWDADGKQYETWFYWTKGQAYHFGDGTQLEKTDWSAALASK